MVDEFDAELQQEPEGSIMGPIFIGCSAMGLGCLFSLAAITIGTFFFVPGVWDAIVSFGGDPMLEEAMVMVEANEDVVAALGTPLETDLVEVDEAPGANMGNVEFGDLIEVAYTYDLTGPNGTGQLEIVGSRVLVADDEWQIRSVTVTLVDGQVLPVYADESDRTVPATPPTPDQPSPVDEDTADAPDEGAVPEDAEAGEPAQN